MFRYGILARIILALLIVGLLFAGGYGLYRLGFAQGYQTGVITAAPADGQGAENPQGRVAPYAYGPWGYGYGPHFWGPGFGFFPFFPFFGFGFFLLFLLLIGGLFRGWGYRRWNGPGPGYGAPEGEQAERRAEEGK